MTASVFPLSDKQARTVAKSDGRVNVWSGAIRSGKTFASSLRWLMYMANPPQGGQYIMVGRTRDSIARNVLAPLQDPLLFGELAHEVNYTTGAPFATILGKKVYVMGASDSKAEKVLRGLTVAGAYVDEVTILARELFVQLLGRMNVPGAKCFVTTNPDSPHHWFKAEYLDRVNSEELSNWRSWYFTLEDNPSLTEEYKQDIKREFTGLFYRRFVLGEWVAAAGAVFDMWDPENHLIAPEDMPPMLQFLSAGIDYGTTNATSCILLALGSDGCLYAVDEYTYKPSAKELRKTDAELSREIRQFLPGTHLPLGTHTAEVDGTTPVIIDPAAASFRVQMFNDGVVNFPAENDVLYGIRLVSTLLSAGKLKVSTTCKNLIAEVPGYVWNQQKTDEGKDQVVKLNDHSLDALRYAVATTENRWRRHITI